mmetsp:Transcript_20270/g.40893  ORF Transcript_20270/g.40893 Transcript_20270/m.40893 type:complete len:413 (+) Transcript_20270:84-1322(+)
MASSYLFLAMCAVPSLAATAAKEVESESNLLGIPEAQLTSIVVVAMATIVIAGLLCMQFRTMDSKTRLVLFACIPGIVVPLIAYSYEQERVMQTHYLYEETGEKEFFARSWTPILVFFNRFGAAAFAFLMLLYTGEPMGLKAPMLSYLMVATSNVVATICQYVALKYVSFQMQSLSKCSKIMWVMAWGFIMSRKKYNTDDYITAMIVTAGAFMFGLAGNIETGYDAEQGVSSTTGILLMVGYLMADGLTSTLQEKIFRGYRLTHFNQMMYVNLFSSVLAASMLAVKSNIIPDFLVFVKRHPECMYDIGLLVVSQITAQNFIYLMIKNFGALLLATIMYSRQLLSIIFNTMWFEDPMTRLQWVSVMIVFGALFSKSKMVRKMVYHYLCAKTKEQPADVEMELPKQLSQNSGID